MKLREVQHVLRENIPNLELKRRDEVLNGQTFIGLENLIKFKEAIKKIYDLNIINGQLDYFQLHSLFLTLSDYFRLPVEQGSQFLNSVAELKKTLIELLMFTNQLVGEESSEPAIYIKFPEVKDFSDVKKYSDEFQLVLSQLILDDEIGGRIQIESVENGSIWFAVLLGAIPAVKLVSYVVRSAALILRDFKQNTYLSEQTRSIKLDNNQKQRLQEYQTFFLDLYVKNEAKYIKDNFFPTQDEEKTARIEHAINVVTGLLEKGADFKPGLNNEKSLILDFPNLKNLPGIQSHVKNLDSVKPESDKEANPSSSTFAPEDVFDPNNPNKES